MVSKIYIYIYLRFHRQSVTLCNLNDLKEFKTQQKLSVRWPKHERRQTSQFATTDTINGNEH